MVRPVAEITGVRLFHDQLHQRLPAQLFSHLPGPGLVNIHKGRFDLHRLVEAEAKRLGLRLDRVIAAIGIAGIVRLAHAADQHTNPAPHGQRAGQCQEQKVPSRHERGRQAGLGRLDGHIMRHRRLAEALQHGRVDHVILTQTAGPGRVQAGKPGPHILPAGQLHRMALAIIEADRLDLFIALQRPCETGGRILPAGKQDERTGVGGSGGHLGHDAHLPAHPRPAKRP